MQICCNDNANTTSLLPSYHTNTASLWFRQCSYYAHICRGSCSPHAICILISQVLCKHFCGEIYIQETLLWLWSLYPPCLSYGPSAICMYCPFIITTTSLPQFCARLKLSTLSTFTKFKDFTTGNGSEKCKMNIVNSHYLLQSAKLVFVRDYNIFIQATDFLSGQLT